MNDYRAIENLLYLYAERIDAGDLKGTANLFRNATITASGGDQPIQGYDGALAMFQHVVQQYDDGTPLTQHLITNPRIRVDEAAGTAESTARFSVLQATDTLALQPIIAGRYEDQFAKQDGEWYFTQRTMIPVLHGDLSKHLLTTSD